MNLSIISPKYSPDLVKLYEKVNHLNGDFKLEKHNSFTFLILMHTSIQTIGNNYRKYFYFYFKDVNPLSI